MKLQPYERPGHCSNAWGVLIDAGWPKDSEDWILRVDTGERVDLPERPTGSSVALLPATPAGSVHLSTSTGALVRMPMDGGPVETVFERWRSAGWGSCPDGDHLLARAEGSLHLVRAEGCRVLPLAGPRCG